MIRIDNNKVLTYINANKDLKKLFVYYIEHNISFDNPYHNFNHMLEMVGHIINIYNENSSTITELDLYILIISAMFHDFNHSKGLYNDAINVYNAKLALKDAITYIDRDEEFKEYVIEECSKNIDATEYPYKIEYESLNLNQRIIRECDILVTLYDDFLTQSLFGLKSEMQGKDFVDFIQKYSDFLLESYTKLNLEYSKNTVAENGQSIIDTINNLIKIFS